MKKRFWAGVYIAAFTLHLTPYLWANGLQRNGIGSESAGLSGANIAFTRDPLTAMGKNPALLRSLPPSTFSFNIVGALAEGDVHLKNGNSGYLSENSGIFPETALILPFGRDVTLGVSVIPDTTRRAAWTYTDVPGGADGNTTYGRRNHLSQNIAVRSALGIAGELLEDLYLGASIGLTYQQSKLRTPYIFQSHPVLAGFKTKLDMEGDDVSPNAEIGFLKKISDTLAFAGAYRTPTKFELEGRARANADTQLANLGLVGVDPRMRYDAEIDAEIPQSVRGGFMWKVHPQAAVHTEVEWIDWAGAYDKLPVRLKNGNNEAINGVVGSDRIDDTVPLDWKSRFVYRLGVELSPKDRWFIRTGYAYGKSPVPNRTLLPLTAAISEHTISAGVGHEGPIWSWDFAWQWDLPAVQRVGKSDILSGEYDNSKVEIEAHWLSLTLRRKI